MVRAFEKVGGADLAWIVDPEPEARAMAAAIAPRARQASHIAEALDDVQAVAVCTPARSHFDHLLPLLEAGKSALVEKPIAMRLEDAARLARAKLPDATLLAGHQLLYHPAFVALSDRVSSGALGKLSLVRTDRSGFLDRLREPGVLWSYGPHDVAMILALTGQEPCDIRAKARPTGSGEGTERIDLGLGFSSGARAEIHLASTQGQRRRRLVAVCEGGTLIFDDAREQGKLLFFDGPPHRIPGIEIPVSDEEPLARECAHFLACLLGEEEPITGIGHAIAVTRVLDAAAACLASTEVKPISSAC